MDSKTCEKCGETFLPNTTGKGSPQRFCSVKCRNRAAQERYQARMAEGIEVPAEKRCPRCGLTKPASEFFSSKRRPDGLDFHCNDCNYERKEVRRGNEPFAKPAGEKACETCGDSKPYSEFHRHRSTADHLTYKCRDCIAQAQTEEAARPPTPKEKRERQDSASNLKTCRYCGIEFVRPKSGRNYGSFCSGRHMSAYHREQRRLNPPTPPQSKRCARCGEEKPKEAFASVPTNADGLHSHCRDCYCSYRREKYQRTAEVQRARQRERYATDPEYRESARRRAKAYVYDHHEVETEKRRKAYRDLTEEEHERRRASGRRYHARKQAKVDAVKEGKQCSRCGERHPATLEFHHRDASTKLFNIADGLTSGGWTEEQIREEIVKCDVLCANCHKIMHWEQRRELTTRS